MGRKKKLVSERKKTVVVSFRVSEEVHRQLMKYAAKNSDDTGGSLNVAGAARRLMLKSLKS
jgi:hypothetical protein